MIEQTKQIHAKVIVRSDQINTMQFCGQCIDVWKSISLVSSVGGQPKKKWLIIVCVYECWRSQNPFAKCNVRIYIVYSYLQWFKNRQLMIIWTDKTKQKKKSEFWGEVSLIHYYFAVDRVRLLWETNISITAANIFGVIGHTGNNVTTGTFPHYYRISGHHRDRRRPQLIIAYRNTNAKQN